MQKKTLFFFQQSPKWRPLPLSIQGHYPLPENQSFSNNLPTKYLQSLPILYASDSQNVESRPVAAAAPGNLLET